MKCLFPEVALANIKTFETSIYLIETGKANTKNSIELLQFDFYSH